jgi:hypothetical protein
MNVSIYTFMCHHVWVVMLGHVAAALIGLDGHFCGRLGELFTKFLHCDSGYFR